VKKVQKVLFINYFSEPKKKKTFYQTLEKITKKRAIRN